MTTKLNKTLILHLAMPLMAGLLILGCESDNTAPAEDAFFIPEGEVHPTRAMLNAQAASGARADSNLRAMHFDGTKLNSLGESKLKLMTEDDDSMAPLVVYMDFKEDDKNLEGRQKSVTDYLMAQGLSASQIEFQTGVNPGTLHPAAPGIAAMSSDGESQEEGVDWGALGQGIGTGMSTK